MRRGVEEREGLLSLLDEALAKELQLEDSGSAILDAIESVASDRSSLDGEENKMLRESVASGVSELGEALARLPQWDGSASHCLGLHRGYDTASGQVMWVCAKCAPRCSTFKTLLGFRFSS